MRAYDNQGQPAEYIPAGRSYGFMRMPESSRKKGMMFYDLTAHQ